MIKLFFLLSIFLSIYFFLRILLKKLEKKIIKERVGFQVAQLRNIPEGLLYLVVIKELIPLIVAIFLTVLIFFIIDF